MPSHDLDLQIFNGPDGADDPFKPSREVSIYEQMNRSFTQMESDPLSPFGREELPGRQVMFPPTSGTPQPRKPRKKPKGRASNPDRKRTSSPRGSSANWSGTVESVVGGGVEAYPPTGKKFIKRKMKMVNPLNKSMPHSL